MGILEFVGKWNRSTGSLESEVRTGLSKKG